MYLQCTNRSTWPSAAAACTTVLPCATPPPPPPRTACIVVLLCATPPFVSCTIDDYPSRYPLRTLSLSLSLVPMALASQVCHGFGEAFKRTKPVRTWALPCLPCEWHLELRPLRVPLGHEFLGTCTPLSLALSSLVFGNTWAA